MILKIGKGKITPTRIFEYIDGCEEIQSYRLNVAYLLKCWRNNQTFNDCDQTFNNFQDAMLAMKEQILRNTTGIDIRSYFARELCEIFYSELGIGQHDVIDFTEFEEIVKYLLGSQDKFIEKVNCEAFASMYLFGVGFKKDNITYLILSTNQPIYLLNNEGRTIEVLK